MWRQESYQPTETGLDDYRGVTYLIAQSECQNIANIRDVARVKLQN